MVHLSKRYLDEGKLKKIYTLFFEVIAKSSNKENFLIIIEDFVSPTEQIMIAKRIAIIYLLTKGLTAINISDYLKVSKSTIAKFALLFYKKETKAIQIIRSLIMKGKVLGVIEDIFADLFVQPGLQKGHWKLKRMFDKSKQDRKTLNVE